jgi:hypothetical protein
MHGATMNTMKITGSGVLTFLSACTVYGNTVIIRSLTVHSVNNKEKDINDPLKLTHDCCEMTVDALLLGDTIRNSNKKHSEP